MLRRIKNGITWFEFEFLNQQPNILHFQSTRIGGQSEPPYDSLNLGFGKDKDSNVLANRLKFADTLGFTEEQVVAQNQIHSTNIQLIDKSFAGSGFYSKDDSVADCDAMLTNEIGICLWAFGADCLPLFFYDKTNEVVGVAHAGWRGTLANIAGKVVATMQENYGSLPEEIFVGMGAGIGVKYYEVGDDVVSAVLREFGIDEPFLVKNPKTGRFHLDLINTNMFLLYQSGIEPQNIEVADLCTFENKDLFYSARRDKITGRQVAGIMLTEN